jgi:hypothetical protein
MVKRGTVVVDLGNGSATITIDDGRHGGTWSGVTRRGTSAAIASDGWRLSGEMRLSPADNGFTADVQRG